MTSTDTGKGSDPAVADEPTAQSLLWDSQLTRLLRHDAYSLSAVDLPPAAIHATPVEAQQDEATFTAYADASADVVMRGGTASGVVYPLALCVIAERFRLRSIGGSSAGAIAAAAAAAAELGRIRSQAATGTTTPPSPPSTPVGGYVTGQVRPGFAGLADLTAWLTEMTPDGPAAPEQPERYRLAALFQPVTEARRAYRVAAAVLRQRYWQLLLLLPLAARPWVPITSALAVVAGVLVTALATQGERWGWLPAIVGAAYAVLAVVAVITGVAVLLLSLQVRASERESAAQAFDAPPGSFWRSVGGHIRAGGRTATSRLFWTGVVLLAVPVAAAILLAVLVVAPPARTGWVLLLGAIGAAAFAAVVNVACYVADFKLRFIDRAASGRYGLISGATPAAARSPLDGVAGLPPVTATAATPALVPWLTTLFDQLAGQGDDDGRGGVLRFGHLWFDRFTPEDSSPEEFSSEEQTRDLGAGREGRRLRLADYEAANYDSGLRLVNLELMASEITQGVAYRFPLIHPALDHAPGVVGFADELRGHAALYVSAADLNITGAQVFPPAVIEALCAGPAASAVVVNDAKADVVEVHQLPAPWNLPVVFAVRLSMSLPFLFQAVPLYRRVDDGEEGLRVERVWFSDGGLTSSFPIHFFDSMLPPWPTLGINLTGTPTPSGSSSPAAGTAPGDFRLPSIRQSAAEPRRLGSSLLAFFGAVFATSRNWRDNMHILLPGFGMRVVAVQLRKGEGDTNIFMKREVTASLALRGARAGTAVRDQFARSGEKSGSSWRQHQAIRLQTAVMSIATSIRGARDGSPVVGILARLDEAPPGGAGEVLARSAPLLDDVNPADVLAVWRAFGDAMARLGTDADERATQLGRLSGRAGALSAAARALRAVTITDPDRAAIRATKVDGAAAELAQQAAAAGEPELAQAAMRLAAVTRDVIGRNVGGRNVAWPTDPVLFRQLDEAAAALDTRAGPLAMASPAASAARLARTWDRHGVMEDRPTPRT